MCIRSVERSSLFCAGALVLLALTLPPLSRSAGLSEPFSFGQPATEQEIAAVAIAIPRRRQGPAAGQGRLRHRQAGLRDRLRGLSWRQPQASRAFPTCRPVRRCA